MKSVGRIIVTFSVIVLSGCQGGSAPAATTVGSAVSGRPLTIDQAEALSSVLLKNYEAGGAKFRATIPYSRTATFVLTGEVNYERHLAGARLTVESSSTQTVRPTELFWNDTDVVEELDGLPLEMATRGRTDVKFLSRPMTTTSPQDIVLKLVLGTASQQRDNPQLVQQGGARFLRAEMIGADAVDVYRFGERTVYWVRKADGLLARVEAKITSIEGTTVVDFLEHVRVDLTGPRRTEVVASTELPAEVLARLTSGVIDTVVKAP